LWDAAYKARRERVAAEMRALIDAPAIVKPLDRPTLARKPQQFDVSELPLFGDGHLQRDLFA
jgi:hypothetical protein